MSDKTSQELAVELVDGLEIVLENQTGGGWIVGVREVRMFTEEASNTGEFEGKIKALKGRLVEAFSKLPPDVLTELIETGTPQKDQQCNIRLTKWEKLAIEKAAAQSGQTPSQFIAQTTLGHLVHSPK